MIFYKIDGDCINYLDSVVLSSSISLLCTEGRIEGAIKKGMVWLILSDT